MKYFYVKPTERCQLRCRHCYIGDAGCSSAELDLPKAAAWIRDYMNEFEIAPEDAYVRLHGGEPLLRPAGELDAFCAMLPEAVVKSITTNLLEAGPEFVELAKRRFFDPEAGRPWIKTSWDWKIRFPSPDLECVWLNNLGVVQSAGIGVTVSICLSRPLIEDLTPAGFLEIMKTYGINNIDFERLTENTTADKSLLPAPERLDEWLAGFERISAGEIRTGMFEDLKQAARGVFSGCRARRCSEDVVTLNADGSVGCCPNIALLKPFWSIDRYPARKELERAREALVESERRRRQECLECNFFSRCNGDCWQLGKCLTPKRILAKYAGACS